MTIYPDKRFIVWKFFAICLIVLFFSTFVFFGTYGIFSFLITLLVFIPVLYVVRIIDNFMSRITLKQNKISFNKWFFFRYTLSLEKVMSYHLEVNKEDRQRAGIEATELKIISFPLLTDALRVYNQIKRQKLVFLGVNDQILEEIDLTVFNNQDIQKLTDTLSLNILR